MKELKDMFIQFFRDRQGVMVFIYVLAMIAVMYIGFYVAYLVQ